jgi:hypothetical protein
VPAVDEAANETPKADSGIPAEGDAPNTAPPPIRESRCVETGDVEGYQVWVGPFVTQDECSKTLDSELKRLSGKYINEYLNQTDASAYVNLDLRYIKTHLTQATEFHPYEHPTYGPMWQLTTHLRFDEAFQTHLEDRWRDTKVAYRLMQTGFGAGGVLLLLATLFAYLKLDTATRGSYTGRLQFAAATAILTLVIAGVLIARWLPWM